MLRMLGLACALRAVLARDDDYLSAGKPVCDYDDPDARAAPALCRVESAENPPLAKIHSVAAESVDVTGGVAVAVLRPR